MASGSLKDTFRTLNAFYSKPSVPDNLPEELQQILDAFLVKYQRIDDHDSQRLQDELLALFRSHVAHAVDKIGPFVALLLRLRPAIVGESRLLEWWELVLRPAVQDVGHRRRVLDEVNEFVQSILDYDAEEDETGELAQLSSVLCEKVLQLYLDGTDTAVFDQGQTPLENEHLCGGLESILINFGRKKPKTLLSKIDGLLILKSHRIQALRLLSAFLKQQPPHLHYVDETDLIDHLLQSLLTDRSTTAVSMALTALMIFLPHIPNTVFSNLPKLFLVYSRLLCWDNYARNAQHDAVHGESELAEKSSVLDARDSSDQVTGSTAWEILSDSEDGLDAAIPELNVFYTLLYGMYPLNFTSYIRKPRKYLKSRDYPDVERLALDQPTIRDRSDFFRQLHLVHPNFFRTTAEEELADNRWLKSDAAEVFTECIQLSVATSDMRFWSNSLWKGKTLSAPFNKSDANIAGLTTRTEPTEPSSNGRPPQKVIQHSDTEPDCMENSANSHEPNGAGTAEVQQPGTQGIRTHPSAINEPIPSNSGALSSQRVNSVASVSNGTGPESGWRNGSRVAGMTPLEREVTLLRNELNFEKYLKQQHLDYIGQLQRKHIREVTVEAETQNLLNSNKALKAKLSRASESYAQLKKETVTSRNQSKKWESELSAKLRTLREDRKKWNSNEETLRLELRKVQANCEQLQKLMVQREAQDRRSQEQLQHAHSVMKDLEKLQLETEQSQDRLRAYESRELSFERMAEEKEDLYVRLENANMNIKSRDLELQKVRSMYERKVDEIQPTPGTQKRDQLSPEIQQMIDSALDSATSQNMRLRKAYNRLLAKNATLELRVQTYEAERKASQASTSDRPKTGDEAFDDISPSGRRRLAPFEPSSQVSPTGRLYSFPEKPSGDEKFMDPIEGFQSPSSGKLSELSRTPPLRHSRAKVSHDPSLRTEAFDQTFVDGLHHPSPQNSLPDHDPNVGSSNNTGLQEEGLSSKRTAAKKPKDRQDKKEKGFKSSGFRGLRGIM